MTAEEPGELERYVQGDLSERVLGAIPKRLPPAEAKALRDRVRNALAALFGPIVYELHLVLEKRRNEPAERLPLWGPEPKISSYPGLFDRRRRFREEIPSAWGLFETVRRRCRSENSIKGRPIHLMAPVGDYGEPLARAIVDAARAMNAAARELAPAADALTRKHRKFLSGWTYEVDASASLHEGIQTYASVTAVLTYHRAEGKDADALLGRIEEDRLFDRLAKGPYGLVGPMAAQGIVPKRTLAVEKTGPRERLALSADFERILQETRAKLSRKESWHTDLGCPVGMRNIPVRLSDEGVEFHPDTLIATLGRDYLRLVRGFYELHPRG